MTPQLGKEHVARTGSGDGLSDAAIAALGGTPPDVQRGPVSPIRWLLPPGLGRWVTAFDRSVELGFDRLRGRRHLDRLFYTASALADYSLLWHLAGTGRALFSAQHEREALRLGVALGVESVAINVGVKSLFRRTRPRRQEHEHHFLRQPRSSSFPSGHATSGFMAATLLSEGQSRWRRIGWHVVASVVAASRVHVGIHHPSDVVAGALIGIGLGHLVRRVAAR
ncbi:MAG TPA: phosphatase PAP2 family protein [Acidimicrobiales bacterium]|nr:phosphatase PAP2 family protein [Acidimicrobiales bacterium]